MSISLNCYLLGDDPDLIFTVEIEKTKNISILKDLIKEKKAPHFDRILASDLVIWEADLPIDSENFQESLRKINLVKRKPLLGFKKISRVFPGSDNSHFNVIVKNPFVGEPGPAVNILDKDYDEFIKCLTVKVITAKEWTMNDVKLNKGIIVDGEREVPPEMKDLESKLRNRRIFNPSDANHNEFLPIASVYSQFAKSYVSSTTTTQLNDHAPVKNRLEFLAFHNLLCSYIPDAPRYKQPKSMSIKATAMKSNFILPAFFWAGNPTDELTYNEELAWKCPMFLKCGAMVNLPRKYTPRNAFSVCFTKFGFSLPLILGEIISFSNEKDRYLMLLQAIALARVIFALRKSGSTEHPFIVAIYLKQNMTAERYILMKLHSESDEVVISKKEFDLVEEDGAISFQREMYNLTAILDSILDILDVKKFNKLKAIKDIALDSHMKLDTTSGAWKETNKSGSRGGPMDFIPEEELEDARSSGGESQGSDSEDEDELEDDLGVFDNDNIRAALSKMNYQVAYIAHGFPHLAPIMDRTTGELVGCLKFAEDGAKATRIEIEILQYFEGLPSEFNHCVRPFGIWSVTGGSIIALPSAGNCLTSLTDLDIHLWSLTRQLFEAVQFMHSNNVAHMDLKPPNILIPSAYGRLTIIDFGISLRLRNEKHLFQGHAGTKGYIAPEIGKTIFSPIRADLWSVGKVVQELCMRCLPSTSRDWLLVLSEQELLNDDPSKRPMMSEVLERMLNFDVSKSKP